MLIEYNPMSDDFLPSLAAQRAEALEAQRASYAEMSRGAFAPNTLRAIRSDTEIFAIWCAANGERFGPPTAPETLARFVDAMGETRKPATVARYVASIDHLHRALDLAVPGASNAVRLALKRQHRHEGEFRSFAARANQECTVDQSVRLCTVHPARRFAQAALRFSCCL